MKKFLNIFLEPRLILDYKSEVHKGDLQEIFNIISSALTESMTLALRNGVKKLKIFGRTDEMLGAFDLIIAEIDS